MKSSFHVYPMGWMSIVLGGFLVFGLIYFPEENLKNPEWFTDLQSEIESKIEERKVIDEEINNLQEKYNKAVGEISEEKWSSSYDKLPRKL